MPFRIRSGARLALTAIAVVPTLLACASSTELAKRSENSLGAHDYDKAYRQAIASLEKQPGNGRARMALSAAASGLLAQRRRQVLDLATVDTVEAAGAALDVEALRAQAIRYGATLPEDSLYGVRAQRIRHAAAMRKDRFGREALRAERPKQAYTEFVTAKQFEPDLKGLDQRIGASWDRAVTRVAVMPFENATGARGLGRDVSDHVQDQLAGRVGEANGFTFTQIVPSERVASAMRANDLGRLGRDDAIALGRSVGARQIVWGRLISLRTDSDSDRYHGTLWRKIVERDSTGERVRYAESPFEAVRRRRTVTLAWSWSLIDVASEESVAGDESEIEAQARSVYSRDLPEGKSSEFVLVPPNQASDVTRTSRVESEWKGTFSSWTVPQMLDEGRRYKARTQYAPEYREAFMHADGEHPVWCDDLPSSGELARIALDEAWKPVLAALRQLDPEDGSGPPRSSR